MYSNYASEKRLAIFSLFAYIKTVCLLYHPLHITYRSTPPEIVSYPFQMYGMPRIHISHSIAGSPQHFDIYSSFLRRTHLRKHDVVYAVLQILSPSSENNCLE